MLEQIGTPARRGVSTPCADAIIAVEAVLSSNPDPVIAEIGVGVGATTLALAKRLDNRGQLLIFDYKETVDELAVDLRNAGYSNIHAFGNTCLTCDSYSWTLAKLALARRQDGPFLDFAFLDGAHTFLHDAPAAILLKEMLKPGGFLLLDDLHWTIDKSPTQNATVNPAVRNAFTAEQMAAQHIGMICDLFLESDCRLQRVSFNGKTSPGRALYVKTLSSS
jgi:predicted O-methyltransferase YrrM